MRTFKIELGLDVRVTVPDDHVKSWRNDAAGLGPIEPNAFLLEMQRKYPDDDEQFALAIVKHFLRTSVRRHLAAQFNSTGLGITLSPASTKVIEFNIPTNVCTHD